MKFHQINRGPAPSRTDPPEMVQKQPMTTISEQVHRNLFKTAHHASSCWMNGQFLTASNDRIDWKK
jgi:hypothetical protein